MHTSPSWGGRTSESTATVSLESVEGGLHFESGRVNVPEEPGLGLECPCFGTLVIRTGETVQSK